MKDLTSALGAIGENKGTDLRLIQPLCWQNSQYSGRQSL